MKMQELVDLGQWVYFGDVELDGCMEVAKNVVHPYLCDDVYHLCKNHSYEYFEAMEKKRLQDGR